jgi:hypothetical protein
MKSASLLRCFPSYLSGKRKGRLLSVLFKHDNIPKKANPDPHFTWVYEVALDAVEFGLGGEKSAG